MNTVRVLEQKCGGIKKKIVSTQYLIIGTAPHVSILSEKNRDAQLIENTFIDKNKKYLVLHTEQG